MNQAPQTRTAEETARRLLVLAAVSAVAAGLDREEIVFWLTQEDLWDAASPAEQRFLQAAQPSERDTIHFSWQMEAVYVMGWALALLPALDPPVEQAGISDILERIPGPGDRAEQFVASCTLRPAAEIHAAAGFALDAHARCRAARSRGERESNGYDIEVAQERHRALNWLIRYENADWDDVATDT
jgi:hypothetical protein